MQELKDAIRGIIEQRIKQGYYFDSHTVISLLLQEHHDTYLLGFVYYKTDTKRYHAEISKMVKDSGLVEDIHGESFSKNVHDNFNGCHLWKRI